RVHLVRYEDLLADTPGTLSEILSFMGARVESPNITRAIENNTLERMRAKEDRARWTVFSRRTEGAHFVGSGPAGSIRPDQIELIERYAGTELRRLGYEPDPSRPFG